MPRARRILFSSLIAGLATSFSTAFPQDGTDRRAPVDQRPGAQAERRQPNAAAAKPIQINDLLMLWERQSEKLKTLDVFLYRIDKNLKWDEELHYEGRAIFKSPQLAYLNFEKVKTARDAKGKLVPLADPKNPKKRAKDAHETIICGANEVWQYLFPVKQVFVYPLAKEQRQRALDEGPLPFLFNMKAEEAKQRYKMTLLGQNEQYYSILVEPRLKQDIEAFRKAQIFLDTKYLLPMRIALISPDNKSSKDFRVEHIVPNAKVEDAWFKGRPIKGWKLIRNPDAQGQMQGNIGAANGQPAQALPPRR
jgi:TIGR03009 family protein